jgi:hypothetical protein
MATKFVIVELENGEVSDTTTIGHDVGAVVVDWDKVDGDVEAATDALTALVDVPSTAEVVKIRERLNAVIDEGEDDYDYEEDDEDDYEDDDDSDEDWEDDDVVNLGPAAEPIESDAAA